MVYYSLILSVFYISSEHAEDFQPTTFPAEAAKDPEKADFYLFFAKKIPKPTLIFYFLLSITCGQEEKRDERRHCGRQNATNLISLLLHTEGRGKDTCETKQSQLGFRRRKNPVKTISFS